MGYSDRLRANTQRSDRFGGMRPPTVYVDYYKTVAIKDVDEGNYPSRLMPPSPSKWPVTPATIAKHRMEIERGEKPKWVLASDSFYEGLGLGDPPIVLDRLLLGLSDLCWKTEVVERNGKKITVGNWYFPDKLAQTQGFVDAISLLTPMRSYVYLLLVKGVLNEIKSTKLVEPGKREWKTYQLSPADKNLPIEEWAPVYLEAGAHGFYEDFLDAIDTAESFTGGKYDVWDRRKGANFVLKRGKANNYGVVAKANPGIEISMDQWKDLLSDKNFPNLKNKLGWMCKDNGSTDETIMQNLEDSWWYARLIKRVPKLEAYMDGEHDAKLDPEYEPTEEEEDADTEDEI